MLHCDTQKHEGINLFKLLYFLNVLGLLLPLGRLNWISVVYCCYKCMLQPLGLQKNLFFKINFSLFYHWNWLKIVFINLFDVSYCWEIFWLISWGKSCCRRKTLLQALGCDKYTLKTYLCSHLNTTKVVLKC